MRILILFLLACSLFFVTHFQGFSQDKNPEESYRHHAVPQQTLGFYAVFLPKNYDREKDKKYPLCVILHGSGSTELGHGRLCESFGRKDVIYLCPRAPYPHLGVMLQHRQPGWTAWPNYPSQWGKWDDAHFPKEEVKDYAISKMYTNWIASCVRDTQKRYRTDGKRIILIGHSQGAAFAHLFAIDHPELVRAYYAYAGYYKDTIKDAQTATLLKQHKIMPFIAHGEADPIVSVEESQNLISYFIEQAVPHKKLFISNCDHGMRPPILKSIYAFVSEQCGRENPPPLKAQVVVTQLQPNSAAIHSGIQVNDVLLHCNKQPITNMENLRTILDTIKQDQEITLTVQRKGKLLHFTFPSKPLGIHLADSLRPDYSKSQVTESE